MLGGLLLASPSQAGERNFKIPAPRAHLVVLAPRLSVSGTVAAYLLQKHLAALQPAKTARCYLLPRYRQQLAKPTDAPEPQHDWLGKTAVKEQNLLLLDGLGGAFSLRSLFRATRRVHALRLVGESATGHRAFGGVAAATEYGDPILRKIFDGASKPEPRGQTPIHLCDLGPEAGGTIAKVWRKIAPGQPLPEWAELLTQAAEQPFSATDAHALREALFTRFNGSEAVGDHWIGRTRPRRGRRRAQSGRAGANGQKRSEGLFDILDSFVAVWETEEGRARSAPLRSRQGERQARARRASGSRSARGCASDIATHADGRATARRCCDGATRRSW
jgi:hypothetical protein